MSSGKPQTERAAEWPPQPSGGANTPPDQQGPYRLYIDGRFCEPASGATLESINPTTGRQWYQFARGGSRDVDRAVQAAQKALESASWRHLSPVARSRVLRRIADATAELEGQLAVIETLDNGKVLREVRAQHDELASTWEYFAGWPDKHRGSVTPSATGTLSYVVPEPHGVIAAIVPWNSPLAITTSKLAPALAAGNTVIIKPSEQASASLLAFVEVLERAGVPPGVVNIVTGLGSEAGEALAAHPGVDFITFTGGTETGRRIAALAAARPVPTMLELGGRSPNIVFADADLDQAVEGVVTGAFAAAGQSCVAGSRCLIERGVYDEFVGRVVERVRRLRLGDPLQDDTDVGPLAFRRQMEKVLSYIEIGIDEGCRILVGGRRSTTEDLRDGFFIEPTVVDEVHNEMRIAREEIFGPVLVLLPFGNDADAIRLANDSPYGLAAGIWTRSLSRAHVVARALDAGTVWVNTYREMSDRVPFGGFKRSGYGKEGGEEVVRAYSRFKTVWVSLDEGSSADQADRAKEI